MVSMINNEIFDVYMKEDKRFIMKATTSGRSSERQEHAARTGKSGLCSMSERHMPEKSESNRCHLSVMVAYNLL